MHEVQFSTCNNFFLKFTSVSKCQDYITLWQMFSVHLVCFWVLSDPISHLFSDILIIWEYKPPLTFSVLWNVQHHHSVTMTSASIEVILTNCSCYILPVIPESSQHMNLSELDLHIPFWNMFFSWMAVDSLEMGWQPYWLV